MSEWHRREFGDPCASCGFIWPESLAECLRVVRSAPGHYSALIGGRDPTERHPALVWTAGEYVCHVTDNLRIWAERLAGAAFGGSAVIATYDSEGLAAARRYAQVAVTGALWSLAQAATEWTAAVELADAHGVILVHPERGALSVFDVASGNAHDAHHHGWDIERSFS